MSLRDFEELPADAPDDERWEPIGGRVARVMVGARWEHDRIISNLAAGLDGRFRGAGSPCRTLREHSVPNGGSSPLPDPLVDRGRPAPGATFPTDATVLVEVLSEGTRRHDREDGWAVHQTLPILEHHVLVTRDRPRVEVIDRDGAEWNGHRIADGLAASPTPPSLHVTPPLAEIHADVFA